MNIFLDSDENVKIGDFGVSKVLDHTRGLAKTLVGTPYYLSPELCENQPYGTKSDVWALGCILYELCTLKHPFDALNQGALILKIIKGTYQQVTNYSQEMVAMLKGCLCKSTQKRLSTSQILANEFVMKKAKELNITLPSDVSNQFLPQPILQQPSSSSSSNSNPSKEFVVHQVGSSNNKENNVPFQQQPLSARGAAKRSNNSPTPLVQPPRPSSGLAKKIVPAIVPSAVANKPLEKIPSKPQLTPASVIKPPIVVQKKPILIPKPTPVVFNQAPIVQQQQQQPILNIQRRTPVEIEKPKSQKEKEIEAVRNLPQFVAAKSSSKPATPEPGVPTCAIDKVQSIPTQISSPLNISPPKSATTALPNPIVEQVKTNITKPESTCSTPVSVEVNFIDHSREPQADGIEDELAEDEIVADDTPIDQNQAAISWSVHEQVPNNGPVAEEPSLSSQNEPEQSTIAMSNDDTSQGAKIVLSSGRVIYEKSKHRVLERIMQKIDELHNQRRQILAQIETIIGKEKTDSLVKFFQKIAVEDGDEDETTESEKIFKFVFGKIAFENAHIIQDIYSTIHLDESIAEHEKEVNEILSA